MPSESLHSEAAARNAALTLLRDEHGIDQFALALARLCEFNWSHMRSEETSMLPEAERTLTDADWLGMAEAFAANDDPLFGIQRRREFERLHHRIANLAPRKLKPALPDDAAR